MGLASYLVTTKDGHILINSNLEESVPQIRENVEKLGFKFSDIKILVISHAHSDHCAGSAQLIRETGAQYFVMEEDADFVEKGGEKKSRLRPSYLSFPPAKVDRRLKDGDEVKLGDTTLVARLTPGHTPGCTTWTMRVDGLNAVIIGSPNVNPGYLLVENKEYPKIASDYEKTFQVLKSLPVDLFLGSHGSHFNMKTKVRLMSISGGKNPFVDPEGYHKYVEDREHAFRKNLEYQKAAKQQGP